MSEREYKILIQLYSKHKKALFINSTLEKIFGLFSVFHNLYILKLNKFSMGKRLKKGKQRSMRRRMRTGKKPMCAEQKEARKKLREAQSSAQKKLNEAKKR